MDDGLLKVFVTVLASVGILAFACIIGLLLAFPVMWCWNYVMPYLFNLKEITWGMAWCLNFLSTCLIKSTLTNNK